MFVSVVPLVCVISNITPFYFIARLQIFLSIFDCRCLKYKSRKEQPGTFTFLHYDYDASSLLDDLYDFSTFDFWCNLNSGVRRIKYILKTTRSFVGKKLYLWKAIISTTFSAAIVRVCSWAQTNSTHFFCGWLNFDWNLVGIFVGFRRKLSFPVRIIGILIG